MKEELVYLGFVTSQEGLKIYFEKEKATILWLAPKSTFEVQSFHGLVIFYRKFIKKISGICAPLIACMR
jgi:hypothetical protein